MDEREFVERRQTHWRELSALLDRAASPAGLKALTRQEVRSLGPLYRRAASDLAYARAHAVSEGLVNQLNALVARGYAMLYRTDTREWKGFRNFFVFTFPDTFRRRLPFFLACAAFLLLGWGVGYALVAQDKSNITLFVPPGHQFYESLKQWESGEVSTRMPDGQAAVYAAGLMRNNIQVTFNVFAVGILGGVFTCVLLLYNGALLGAFAGAITHAKQHHTFWPGILPHGVVELSEICIAAAAGLSLGWALLAPGPYKRKDALVLAARDSVSLIIGGVFLLIFAGLVEGFVSHSLLPAWIKVTFGILSGIALYGYLFLSGRKAVVD